MWATPLLSLQAAPYLPREYWESLGPLEAPPQQPWSVAVLLQLGKQLAETLVQAVQMPRSLAARHGAQHYIPVLYHVYSFRSFRQVRTQARMPVPLYGSSHPQRDVCKSRKRLR